MYSQLNADGSLNSPMDVNPSPGGSASMSVDEIFDVYKRNFMRHYNGDRLPYGIYLHATVGLISPNHLLAFKKFQKEVASQYADVYFISNQQLLEFVQSPVSAENAESHAALQCDMPAIESSNAEICDGIDNKGGANADEGLVQSCKFGDRIFSTCFGCPSEYPSPENPAPARSGGRYKVPDIPCPNLGVWDPVSGSCVASKRMRRPEKPVLSFNLEAKWSIIAIRCG